MDPCNGQFSDHTAANMSDVIGKPYPVPSVPRPHQDDAISTVAEHVWQEVEVIPPSLGSDKMVLSGQNISDNYPDKFGTLPQGPYPKTNLSR